MSNALAMIGFPENVLRMAATGILIEEGEVSVDLAISVIDGSFSLHHYPNIDGRVMKAIRKAASVMMTLRANDMLKLPEQKTECKTLPVQKSDLDRVEHGGGGVDLVQREAAAPTLQCGSCQMFGGHDPECTYHPENISLQPEN